MNTTDTRAAALAFLKAQEVGVLATSTQEEGPSARTLYFVCDDSFAIYFLTLRNTRKVMDIAKDARAAFTVSDISIPATLQIQGTVEDCTDSAVIDETVSTLIEKITAKGDHFAPVAHMDASVVRFYKLTPSWIRYGDFTEGTDSHEVFTAIV